MKIVGPVIFKLVLVGALFAQPLGHSAPLQQEKQPKQTQRSSGASSLTGCVDEQDGQYVLIDDRSLAPVANLQADGFPQEGFAKHVGHKVTVRGTSTTGGSRPVFKVRSIDKVSDTCGPR